MKLVLEILPHTGDERVIHRVLEKFPAFIGRGFDNDVILNDPHVSPQHLRIDYDGHGCFVSDLDSDNGLGINGAEPVHGQRLPLRSGDSLRAGQTEMRVYLPHHPVASTARLQRAHPAFAWLSLPSNVWACFVLATVLMLFWTYLEIWTEEPGVTLAAAAGGTIGSIVLWAAMWSVAGRLIRHKGYFKSHLAMFSLYVTAGLAAWYIDVYIDFLTNENWLAQLVTYGINFVLLAFLFYGGLTMASRMPEKRRRMAAAFFSGGLMAGIFALNLVVMKNFNQPPLYPATLEPYLSQLAPTDSVGEFMSSNEKLFSGAD